MMNKYPIKKFTSITAIVVGLLTITSFTNCDSEPTWQSLFDGKTLNNWKVGDNAGSFKVEDGSIVVNGQVAHIFYDGDISDHRFKDFEFKAEVMTTPGFQFRYLFSYRIPARRMAEKRLRGAGK